MTRHLVKMELKITCLEIFVYHDRDNFMVLLMEYSFLHKGLKQSDITFAALYVNVPV